MLAGELIPIADSDWGFKPGNPAINC